MVRREHPAWEIEPPIGPSDERTAFTVRGEPEIVVRSGCVIHEHPSRGPSGCRGSGAGHPLEAELISCSAGFSPGDEHPAYAVVDGHDVAHRRVRHAEWEAKLGPS